ncbi:hypothetical protein B484DRAFT_408463 [Ochromonadaceae sp. CCMP2298]|nr:hypothetical protein B484DRAFT_408463 [Ochromonadaceae sp. CCMP2298]
MSCSQPFRNGGWDVSVYSSSAEYFAEDKGAEAECARLREAAKRMQVKIQQQEGDLELERERGVRTDGRVAELEDEVAKLRKQVHRRNCRLTEQEVEIGELQDVVQDGQDAQLQQAQRDVVQLRRAVRTRGKSLRTYLANQDSHLAELAFHNASLQRVLDQDPEASDSSSADEGTKETEVADDAGEGTKEADGRDEGTEARGRWTETDAERAARIAAYAARIQREEEVAVAAEEDEAYRRHHDSSSSEED